MNDQLSPWVGYLFSGSQLLFLVVAVAVGIRLLLLARRTRELPELLLGASFVLGSGLGYVALVSGLIALGKGEDVATAVPKIWTGWTLINIGMMLSIGFTYTVYRRGEAWAKGLGLTLFALLWIGMLGRGMSGQFSQQFQFSGIWYFVHQGTILVGISWALVESLRYHRLMKKRLELGLSDPMVTNRFLLWGMGSACGVGISILGSSPTIYPMLDPKILPMVSTVSLISMASLGVIEVGLYWLTFFPLERYRAWVVGRHAAQS